ncbi:MAG: hypothetical protein ACM3NW_04150, partial [Syntrophomonadaceae bacterium]
MNRCCAPDLTPIIFATANSSTTGLGNRGHLARLAAPARLLAFAGPDAEDERAGFFTRLVLTDEAAP